MLGSLLFEKIRGTDYVMIHEEMNGEQNCGNYTMSPNKVLRRVFEDIDDIPEKGFIDVGSGKGYAVKMAAKEGFRISGGVEYNKYLYDICVNNLKLDGISAEYVYHGMAQDYDGYDQFDVFYFNNPFGAEIIAEVAKKIMDTHKEKKCRCYYLNPNAPGRKEAFLDTGFRLVKIIKDPSESYFYLYVYEN